MGIVDGSDLKRAIIRAVEHERNELARISRSIHANPRIGFKEEKADGLAYRIPEARNFTLNAVFVNSQPLFGRYGGAGR